MKFFKVIIMTCIVTLFFKAHTSEKHGSEESTTKTMVTTAAAAAAAAAGGSVEIEGVSNEYSSSRILPSPLQSNVKRNNRRRSSSIVFVATGDNEELSLQRMDKSVELNPEYSNEKRRRTIVTMDDKSTSQSLLSHSISKRNQQNLTVTAPSSDDDQEESNKVGVNFTDHRDVRNFSEYTKNNRIFSSSSSASNSSNDGIFTKEALDELNKVPSPNHHRKQSALDPLLLSRSRRMSLPETVLGPKVIESKNDSHLLPSNNNDTLPSFSADDKASAKDKEKEEHNRQNMFYAFGIAVTGACGVIINSALQYRHQPTNPSSEVVETPKRFLSEAALGSGLAWGIFKGIAGCVAVAYSYYKIRKWLYDGYTRKKDFETLETKHDDLKKKIHALESTTKDFNSVLSNHSSHLESLVQIDFNQIDRQLQELDRVVNLHAQSLDHFGRHKKKISETVRNNAHALNLNAHALEEIDNELLEVTKSLKASLEFQQIVTLQIPVNHQTRLSLKEVQKAIKAKIQNLETILGQSPAKVETVSETNLAGTPTETSAAIPATPTTSTYKPLHVSHTKPPPTEESFFSCFSCCSSDNTRPKLSMEQLEQYLAAQKGHVAAPSAASETPK